MKKNITNVCRFCKLETKHQEGHFNFKHILRLVLLVLDVRHRRQSLHKTVKYYPHPEISFYLPSGRQHRRLFLLWKDLDRYSNHQNDTSTGLLPNTQLQIQV